MEDGRCVWLGAGEEDADFIYELYLLKNEFSSLTLSRISVSLILLLLEACDLLPPWRHISYVFLLELTLQLSHVHTSLLFLILTHTRFCTDLNNFPVSLTEGSSFLVEELFQVTGDPGFIIGKAPLFWEGWCCPQRRLWSQSHTQSLSLSLSSACLCRRVWVLNWPACSPVPFSECMLEQRKAVSAL